jgi:ABC-type amino acid transport substrate-binding protein
MKTGTEDSKAYFRIKKMGFLLLLSLWLIPCLSGPLLARDLEDIKKDGVLRHLGIPYANFVTGSGDGMDVDMMKDFAKFLGVKYQFVATDWNDIFGDLTGKKIKTDGLDIQILGEMPIKGDVAANGITVLPWREKIIAFSAPTFPNQVWLVARADSPVKPIKSTGNLNKDIEAVKKMLHDRSLIGKTGTCLDPKLYQLESTGASIKLFEGSLNDIAPAVINQEADLTLLDVPDALVALQKWSGKIKVLGPISPVQNMAVAFSKESPKLLAAFNAFLKNAKKNGSYLALVKKYYPFAPSYFHDFFKGVR